MGIPTVQDRVIQQGLLLQLSPLFEPLMSAHSYGFRPGRSAHDAVMAARGHVMGGKRWVVDIDLKSFFDQVDHDKLMHLVGFCVQLYGGTTVSDKSLKRLKERVRGFWTARQSKPLAELKQDWQQYIVGWWNYFMHAS